MGFLKIFSGKTPEDHERKGDACFADRAFGEAKLAYEAGLDRLEKKFPDQSDLKERLKEKIAQSREALALAHKERGEEMLASQYAEGAADAFRLALELTEDPALEAALQKRLHELDRAHEPEEPDDLEERAETPGGPAPDHASDTDAYFEALCGAFSDPERERAYYSYGDAFKHGFVALNQGDFHLAETRLSQAMAENPGPESYIPLELGAAYLNLGRMDTARDLLTTFVDDHPASLAGYQLLCEILWEMQAFDRARELLQSCPESIAGSPRILLLEGETLFQAGRYEAAEALFQEYLDSNAWDEGIALALARTCEALGQPEKARNLYGRIMDACTGCGRQVPPLIKQQYADLSMACGQCTTAVLEMYLSLVQEDPANKAHYYEKIIEIYTALGNEIEAERFRGFARES